MTALFHFGFVNKPIVESQKSAVSTGFKPQNPVKLDAYVLAPANVKKPVITSLVVLPKHFVFKLGKVTKNLHSLFL